MTDTTRLPRGHIPALDGLRGAAVLAVIAYHVSNFSSAAGGGLVLTIWQKATLLGWSGVDLFFVLSGFLITGILLDSRSHPRYFRTFYARRFLRIFPLYYGYLAVLFFVLPHLLSPRHAAALRGAQPWFWLYLPNVRFALTGWPGGIAGPALGHLWSLAVEEQFYLLWPVAVLLLSGRNLLRLVVLGIAASVLCRALLYGSDHGVAAYVLTPSRLDGLGTGAIIALVARRPSGLRRMGRLAPAAAVTGLCSFVACLLGHHFMPSLDALCQSLEFTALSLFFGSGLVLALGPSPVARAATHPALRFFGKYSYGLYVWHPGVILSLWHWHLGPDVLARHVGSPFLASLLFTAGVLATTTGVALASWYLVEARFLALKHRIPYRGESSGPAAAAPGSEGREPEVARSAVPLQEV